ncbi:TonB-dependent receptor [Litorivivens sp.]|uniref:TonB-dependent receptor n=5 Tax=Litorivivens sp. TaxID=2020868 RepID=UPI00356AE657
MFRRPVALALFAFSFLTTSVPGWAETSRAVRDVIEEVVVTARKREENIQETPLAVTALSGEDLRDAGIDNVQDLSKSVPSLQINKGQGNQIYIRGIGERTGFVRVDPTVGVYLDGLFLPRADGQLLDTVDVDSLQVLRGPQGTLFGKNTTGGALVLTLAKPHEEFEGYVEAGLGSYDTRKLRAGVNLPVTDRFFTRVAFNAVYNEGYMKDVGDDARSNSEEGISALFQTRWDASDTLTVENLLFFGDSSGVMTNTNCNITRDDALFVDGLALLWAGDTDASQGRAFRENCESNSREQQGDLTADKGPNPMLEQDFQSVLFGSTATWELTENYLLKAILGVRRAEEGPIQTADNDGGPMDYNEAYNNEPSIRKSYSLELQLNGSALNNRLNFTTGLFAAAERNTETFTLLTNLIGLDATSLSQLASGQNPTRPASPLGTTPVVGALTGDPLLQSDFELDNATYAAFLQASYDLTEALQLTLGVRYTQEVRKSGLTVIGTDLNDLTTRLQAADPRYVPLTPPGPLAALSGGQTKGLYTFAGSWLEDPVGIASNVFRDQDGDGIPDYKMDWANTSRFDADETFSQVTPMLSLSYVFDEYQLENTPFEALTTYFTYSDGFKSGFSEPRGVEGLARIEPEEVANLELGFKMDLLDRRMRLNIATYNMDYRNMQLVTVSNDSAGNLIVVFTNAGEATIRGSEMELSWLPFAGAVVSLNYSNNNYFYSEFEDTDLKELALRGNAVPVDRSGEPFPAAPEESASLGLQMTFPTDIGLITPRLDISYKGDVFFGLDATSAEVYRDDERNAGANEYVLVDLRLTWMNDAGDWRVTAYGTNILDKRYINSTVAVTDSIGTFNQGYGDPRVYGVDVTWSF